MTTIEYISDVVGNLVKKYGTRDPFEICKQLKIRVRYKDLGVTLKAFYFYQSRIKNIVINSRAGTIVQHLLCSHELGHAVLHPSVATIRGFQEIELFDTLSVAENEANLFAAELIISDNDLLALLNDKDKTFFSISKELCVPAELLDFKFRILKNKGYRLEQPIYAQSNFLKENIPGCYDDEH